MKDIRPLLFSTIKYIVPFLFFCIIGIADWSAYAQRRLESAAITVVEGVLIEHYPQVHQRFKAPWTKMEDAQVCDPTDQRAACGKAYWNDRPLPLDVRYETSVPAVVRLEGPMDDVIFSPFARCIITDREGKRRSADAPGIECRTVLEESGDYLRWAFGGHVSPTEGLTSGTYTGSIAVTVRGMDRKWEFDVPITLEVKKRQATCEFALPKPKTHAFPRVGTVASRNRDVVELSIPTPTLLYNDGEPGSTTDPTTNTSYAVGTVTSNIPGWMPPYIGAEGATVVFRYRPPFGGIAVKKDGYEATVHIIGTCLGP